MHLWDYERRIKIVLNDGSDLRTSYLVESN